MKPERLVIPLAICWAILAVAARAEVFGPYCGFDDMSKRSAAIIVARTPPYHPIDLATYDPSNGTLSGISQPREVRVLRTIKGDIPEGKQLLTDIGFFPVHGPQKISQAASTSDTIRLDALRALDQVILDTAQRLDQAHVVRPAYDTDYLLFLKRNDLNPHEPVRWLTINQPGSAIILKKGAYEAARKEQAKISAGSKQNQSGKTQAEKDRAARREVIRLILNNLDASSTSLRRQIEPLLEK